MRTASQSETLEGSRTGQFYLTDIDPFTVQFTAQIFGRDLMLSRESGVSRMRDKSGRLRKWRWLAGWRSEAC